MKPKINIGETLLGIHLDELGLAYVTQAPVCEGRKWKWDILLVESKIAIEIDGFFKGRHGAGWGADNEKQNVGTLLGYRVLRFSTQDVKNGKAKEFLEEWLR